MSGSNGSRLTEIFVEAVQKFRKLSEMPEQDINTLVDAADAVFLARDMLPMAAYNSLEVDMVLSDVAEVKEFLKKNGIAMNTDPQMTSTGKPTYRILNKPNRFDA